MYKNYFKTLWRNMQKNKLHTAINIVGMSVAFTCSILLFLMVYFHFSFDKFNANGDRIFKLYRSYLGPHGQERGASMAYPMRSAVLSGKVGISKATLIRDAGSGIRYKDKELDVDVKLVDDDFFRMFSFPVIAGNARTPLGNPGSVVLRAPVAKAVFGGESPIGKTVEVKISGIWKALTVSAVTKDPPINSSIQYDVLARTELHSTYSQLKNSWNFEHSDLYVMLAPSATLQGAMNGLRQLNAKNNSDDTSFLKTRGYQRDKHGDYISLGLLPLRDLHFDDQLGTGNPISKSSLYIILLIGILILLIACFNFVNLNIGLSFTRTKEMGIRKCLGAGKRQIWLQVWGESFLVCLSSALIGGGAAAILIKGFNKLYAAHLDSRLLYQPSFLLILLGVLLLVSLIAGGYPSSFVSKLRVVEVLKGKFSVQQRGLFRHILIGVQFVIAGVLISTTIIIYQQFRHLREAPLGYATTSLISVPIQRVDESAQLLARLRTRLATQPSVIGISGTSVNLGVGKDGSVSKWGYGFDFNGRAVMTDVLVADYNILNTLGITPEKGRDFSTAYGTDSTRSVIITESMAKQLTDKDALGLSFYMDSSQPKLTVVGIIPNIHLYSMHEKAEPLTIKMSSSDNPIGYALIKLKTQNPAAAMDMVKKTFAQLEPGLLFKGSFVDENIERWYSSEKKTAQLFSIAALIAIILCCMGLFGIALISIRRRVKEIGVRKVLGASVGRITSLITREFIKPVAIAMLIAVPIAWWAMHQWLENFIYRVQIQWWVFLAAGGLSVFIAVLTVSIHAVKAARTNPVKSLRTE